MKKDNNKKSCYISGQIDKLTYRQRDKLFEKLYSELEKLVLEGYTDFVFSNNGILETVARVAVISLKLRYRNIKTVYAPTRVDEDIEQLGKKYNEVRTPVADSLTIIDNSDYCLFYKLDNESKDLDYAKHTNTPHSNLA